MSKGINIRDDLWERWNREKDQDGLTSLSFSEWIDSLINGRDEATNEYTKIFDSLQATTINQEGRFEGSKGLSGKRIEWREKGESRSQL